MTSKPIITFCSRLIQFNRSPAPRLLNEWGQERQQLPAFVRHSAVAMKYLEFLSPLAWEQLPQRAPLPHTQQPAIPYAAFIAACLVKLDQQLVSMSHLGDYLLEHPELVWLLGFPCHPDRRFRCGFDPQQSLSTPRHLTRLLRYIPNELLQRLLDSTVQLLQVELAQLGLSLGEAISLDTKHILAWVTENNPKAYVAESRRLDKTCQPAGDPDCTARADRRHGMGTTACRDAAKR